MPNQIIQSHGGQLCKDHSDTTFAKSLYHQVRTPYLSNLELTISDDRLREFTGLMTVTCTVPFSKQVTWRG